MINKFFKGNATVAFHLQLLKNLMLAANGAGLIIYVFVHFIFFDFPMESSNEMITLVKLFSVCSLFALVISAAVMIADAAEFLMVKKQGVVFPSHLKTVFAALVILVVILSACNTPVTTTVGIKKDFNTGMSAAYAGIEPGKTFLAMNNEVLNHTDIPLGESFLVVNDNINGLQEKNGKVTVGCSLKITDKSGKALLEEKDLFAGHDTFDAKDAKMLKCTVNTGAPMQTEEKYDVAVTFWDKNGSGKIDNKVTIRCIDIP